MSNNIVFEYLYKIYCINQNIDKINNISAQITTKKFIL